MKRRIEGQQELDFDSRARVPDVVCARISPAAPVIGTGADGQQEPERGWLLCAHGCIACRTARQDGRTDGRRAWL